MEYAIAVLAVLAAGLWVYAHARTSRRQTATLPKFIQTLRVRIALRGRKEETDA